MQFPTIPTAVKPQTISEITGQIKALVEGEFALVWVVGEIGSLTVASSGHAYFNLKDKNSVLRSCMWKATAQKHRYAFKEGQEVVARGRLSVYAPRGDYQLIVEELHQKGVGAQDLALRRLKEKLHKLGYFDPARKRQLPPYPRRIALIASRTGAAIRDMLEILTRRWPQAEIWVCGVRVQGDGAAEEIAAALRRLNEFKGVDVAIIGRGGGSSEDLAAFNAEIVAQAIYESRAPVVSAVGHEIDVTVADLVADVRAATPSEAAELTTPDRLELLEWLRGRGQRLHGLLLGRFQQHKQRLALLSQRRVFVHPLERVREQQRRVDDWDERLLRAMKLRLEKAKQRIGAFADQLESLSPLNVLSRGYSVTRTPTGEVIRSSQNVQPGDEVEILLHEGKLRAMVKES
jgi:exodeoxyribonuclease VII large subunit